MDDHAASGTVFTVTLGLGRWSISVSSWRGAPGRSSWFSRSMVMGKRHSRKRVRRALPSLLLQRAWFPRLYGNAPGEAALEMTLQGSALMVAAPAARLAFAGDFALTVDGRSAAP